MDKKKKIYCSEISQLCPIIFLLRVDYRQYTVGKRRKHAGVKEHVSVCSRRKKLRIWVKFQFFGEFCTLL
jgi:hypothetical protein